MFSTQTSLSFLIEGRFINTLIKLVSELLKSIEHFNCDNQVKMLLHITKIQNKTEKMLGEDGQW